MTIHRIKQYPHPPMEFKDFKAVREYSSRLYNSLSMESTERIVDFDFLKLNNLPWVDVRSYGGVGDGTHDDTAAIQAAVTAAGGRKVFMPGVNYKITNEIPLSTGTDIVGNGARKTRIYQATAGKAVFVIGGNTYFVGIKDMELGANSSYTGAASPDKIGIKFTGDAPNYSWTHHLSRLEINDFHKGISIAEITPDSGWSCNVIRMDQINFRSNTTGLYTDTSNCDTILLENCFFGFGTGEIGMYFEHCSTVRLSGIIGGGVAPDNHGTFIKVKFNGPMHLLHCGVEAADIFLDVEAAGSGDILNPIVLEGCFPGAETYLRRQVTFISKANHYRRDVQVTGTDIAVYSDGDRFDAGHDFVVTGGASFVHNRLGYKNTDDKFVNILNDRVEMRASAVPTTGTFRQGDICWNNAPAAEGSPGWMCTTSGTFSAATDNTGDTDGSTAVITGMTDTSDFAVGQYVGVSAGFPTTGPYKILVITATTMTLDTASDSAQSNITVSTPDPVFKAMANLAA